MLYNNPNVLGGPVYDVTQFTRDAVHKYFVAEVSDLLPPHGILTGQIYADAVDAGFTLHNRATGSFAVFAYDHTDKTDGGEDIAGWVFVPTREALRANPQLAGWHVTIIND